MSAHVLVIEDNLTNLDLITYLLRAFGYEVSSETDGLAGLEAARTGDYDLVLADILMPGLDGYELARRFKADDKLATTPLVAVSALAMTGDREKILASGFDGYIPKPIDPQKFAAQIEPFLTRSTHGENSRH
jgi:two-component system, cell cycle response regulator